MYEEHNDGWWDKHHPFIEALFFGAWCFLLIGRMLGIF